MARAILTLAAIPVGFYLLAVLGLVYLRFLPPLTTGVQLQRGIEARMAGSPAERKRGWMDGATISPHLKRAVIAAEDARFYQHRGFDWKELDIARRGAARRGGRARGASTITQQLVKNLFLTTHRSWLRKAAEAALTPAAEVVLGKERILELYLNVVEWGPGVYGAEAAARHHFGIPAAELNRDQAARLAAILPAPRTRSPARMNDSARRIQQRMGEMGW
jgi:monofunctional glycosyltransferase